MNTEPIKEVLNELFSHLERLETQNDAILQFLKEKKRVTDKQMAPYLEQAGNASNVRWRAARVRIEHLLSSLETKEEETKVEKKPEIAEAEKTDKEKAAPAEDKKVVAASQQSSPNEPTMHSESKSKEQPDSAKKEESAHPTELTAELAQKEGAEPPAELSKEKKSGDQEAA
ncbi:MAG TPA: hypothetical protein VKU42_10835 [Candidatus Angelobacter sp.]|nr:hypothetical protein [Candidatus Angelobacter sp.]